MPPIVRYCSRVGVHLRQGPGRRPQKSKRSNQRHPAACAEQRGSLVVTPTSELKCDENDEQDTGCEHQKLDGVIVRSVIAQTLLDSREHDGCLPT